VRGGQAARQALPRGGFVRKYPRSGGNTRNVGLSVLLGGWTGTLGSEQNHREALRRDPSTVVRGEVRRVVYKGRGIAPAHAGPRKECGKREIEVVGWKENARGAGLEGTSMPEDLR